MLKPSITGVYFFWNVCVYTCMCTHVWRPEDNLEGHSSGTVSHGPGAHQLGQTDWPRTQGSTCPCLPSKCHHAQHFYMDWNQSPYLHDTLLSYFPSSKPHFWVEKKNHNSLFWPSHGDFYGKSVSSFIAKLLKPIIKQHKANLKTKWFQVALSTTRELCIYTKIYDSTLPYKQTTLNVDLSSYLVPCTG